MERIELIITMAALLAVASVATLAVFVPAYADTLIERAALAGIVIGALAVAWWCWQCRSAPGAVAVLAVASALFAGESVRKARGRPRS